MEKNHLIMSQLNVSYPGCGEGSDNYPGNLGIIAGRCLRLQYIFNISVYPGVSLENRKMRAE